MKEITTKGLLARVFFPTTVLTASYIALGHFCRIPQILLFCILAFWVLFPSEVAMILIASKRDFGAFSLKSSFIGHKKMPLWKILMIALFFFGIAGLLSSFVAPLELRMLAPLREALLKILPKGFDWTDFAHIKTYPRALLILSCVIYAITNVLVGPMVEELFFRGYLTSHYGKQNKFTPILIAILFSMYHFWLPFNNVFRILLMAPISYVAYRKKNIYICICFHCMCNIFSTANFIMAVVG